jgi:hypothetical protein
VAVEFLGQLGGAAVPVVGQRVVDPALADPHVEDDPEDVVD